MQKNKNFIYLVWNNCISVNTSAALYERSSFDAFKVLIFLHPLKIPINNN